VQLDKQGQPQFFGPSGLRIHNVPPSPPRTVSPDAPRQLNAEAGLKITDQTLGTWDGGAMDYSWAVQGLLEQDGCAW
jgi:hypothetical protein